MNSTLGGFVSSFGTSKQIGSVHEHHHSKTRIKMFTFTRIIVITATLALLPASAADKVSYLSALPDGDILQFRFLINGCTGDRGALEFSFTRSTNAAVEVSNLEPVFPAKLPGIPSGFTNSADPFIHLTNRVKRGQLTLRDSDVSGLDRLLDHYRRREPRKYSGQTFIMVSQHRQGKTLATESFYAGGEGMSPDESDGAFSFDQILERSRRIWGRETAIPLKEQFPNDGNATGNR